MLTKSQSIDLHNSQYKSIKNKSLRVTPINKATPKRHNITLPGLGKPVCLYYVVQSPISIVVPPNRPAYHPRQKIAKEKLIVAQVTLRSLSLPTLPESPYNYPKAKLNYLICLSSQKHT